MLRFFSYHRNNILRSSLRPSLAATVSLIPRFEPLTCTTKNLESSRCNLSDYKWKATPEKQDALIQLKGNKSKLQFSRRFSSDNGALTGTWYNELGSEMNLTQSEDGTLYGTYANHAPDSPPVKERLIGSVGSGVQATFGFTVNFESGKYTTTWSGQHFKEDNKEVLMTTWIMTANLPDRNEYWESTNIGQDQFTRQPQKPKGRKSLAGRHLDKMKKE